MSVLIEIIDQRLWQATSGKPGCVGVSDAWSVNVCLGCTSSTAAPIFHRFDIFGYSVDMDFDKSRFQSDLSSPTLRPWVALQKLELENVSLLRSLGKVTPLTWQLPAIYILHSWSEGTDRNQIYFWSSLWTSPLRRVIHQNQIHMNDHVKLSLIRIHIRHRHWENERE